MVTALVGFSSSFVVVLAGLNAVGATPRQAASGLLAGRAAGARFFAAKSGPILEVRDHLEAQGRGCRRAGG